MDYQISSHIDRSLLKFILERKPPVETVDQPSEILDSMPSNAAIDTTSIAIKETKIISPVLLRFKERIKNNKVAPII